MGCVLLIAALTTTAPAFCQGAPDAERIRAAAEEFDAGRRAFKLKDYETAASHFENADRDAPLPEALRNAIRARFEAKQLARAATLSAQALERYPKDKVTMKLAKQVLAAADKELYRLELLCTPACTLLIDTKLATQGESEKSVVFIEPGTHSVLAAWSGERSVGEQVIAVAGESRSLSFTAPPEKPKVVEPPPEPPKPVEPPPAPPSGMPKVVFYSALGATAVLGGVSLWSGLDMRSSPGHDKVRRDCVGQGEECPTYQEGLSKQRRTNVLLAVSGVAAVATGVIGVFFTDWSSGAPSSSTGIGPLKQVVPTVAVGDGLSLGATGQF